MTQTTGQHNPRGRRQTPDEDLRALLQCDPKHFVIGPRKRTYGETAAYVDQVRKTKRWRKLCEEFREFARSQGDSEEGANVAAVFLTVAQLIMDFTGAELGQVPRSWVKMCLDGKVPQDWITKYFGGEHLTQEAQP